MAMQWQPAQTTVCKIGERLPLNNTFSSFQYQQDLQFQPFPLSPSLSPFQCWLFKFSSFFCIASNIDKGGGGGRGSAVWEIIGKVISKAPRRWIDSTNFATSCIVASEERVLIPFTSEHYILHLNLNTNEIIFYFAGAASITVPFSGLLLGMVNLPGKTVK